MFAGGFAAPGAAPPQGGAAGAAPGLYPSLPTSTVELGVRCVGLKDKDLVSKSDPICVLYTKAKGSDKWAEYGRTERLSNTLDPQWADKFVLEYSFEERQPLRLDVYDWDDEGTKDVARQDFLGRFETTLGAVVAGTGTGRQFSGSLQGPGGGGKLGRIFVNAEELQASKEVATIQLAGKKLDNKDGFLGKSDPFFVISKSTPSGAYVVVRRSEVIDNNLNPEWRPLLVPVGELCNGDRARPLRIEVYDHDADGTHDLIGSFSTDLASLEAAAADHRAFPLINEKKRAKKKDYKNSGELRVRGISLARQTTFLDYVQGGTQLNFSVAVDFTASNGNPSNPRSLHHIGGGGGENQYTAAIRSVGSIVEDYDTDKLFPALGFGAKLPGSDEVRHEFFLNLGGDNPYCAGVQGLLDAYQSAVRQVQLFGPTNFAPVIRHVSAFARAHQDGRQYFVLLIITDGVITDLDETMAAVVSASDLPLSLIVVGVGDEDFSAMEALDSDQGLLRHRGRLAARDIVQFVELRKFLDPKTGSWDKDQLAKAVLAEVPRQVVRWMTMKGIKPAQG